MPTSSVTPLPVLSSPPPRPHTGRAGAASSSSDPRGVAALALSARGGGRSGGGRSERFSSGALGSDPLQPVKISFASRRRATTPFTTLEPDGKWISAPLTHLPQPFKLLTMMPAPQPHLVGPRSAKLLAHSEGLLAQLHTREAGVADGDPLDGGPSFTSSIGGARPPPPRPLLESDSRWESSTAGAGAGTYSSPIRGRSRERGRSSGRSRSPGAHSSSPLPYPLPAGPLSIADPANSPFYGSSTASNVGVEGAWAGLDTGAPRAERSSYPEPPSAYSTAPALGHALGLSGSSCQAAQAQTWEELTSWCGMLAKDLDGACKRIAQQEDEIATHKLRTCRAEVRAPGMYALHRRTVGGVRKGGAIDIPPLALRTPPPFSSSRPPAHLPLVEPRP